MCEANECSGGLTVANATANCSGSTLDECTYACDEGYTALGSHVCQPNGVFEGGMCEANECSGGLTVANSPRGNNFIGPTSGNYTGISFTACDFRGPTTGFYTGVSFAARDFRGSNAQNLVVMIDGLRQNVLFTVDIASVADAERVLNFELTGVTVSEETAGNSSFLVVTSLSAGAISTVSIGPTSGLYAKRLFGPGVSTDGHDSQNEDLVVVVDGVPQTVALTANISSVAEAAADLNRGLSGAIVSESAGSLVITSLATGACCTSNQLPSLSMVTVDTNASGTNATALFGLGMAAIGQDSRNGNCTGVMLEECLFTCDAGFTPRGRHTCSADGNFTGGECIANPCLAGLTIPNSTANCTGATGDQCPFLCDVGYLPSGDHVCQRYGSFFGGSCEPVACADGLALANSSSVCAGNTMQTCTYRCNSGYAISGVHTCGVDGAFRGGVCAPLNCTGGLSIASNSSTVCSGGGSLLNMPDPAASPERDILLLKLLRLVVRSYAGCV